VADTLFDIALEVCRAIGETRYGTADSVGTTTTLVDSNLGGDDGDWDDGLLFHIDDKEFSRITDYASTGTVTILDAFTAATASGDQYAIADTEYEISDIIAAINQELMTVYYPVVDTSTITIADNQSEYTLPSDCHDLRQVYYEVQDDADEHLWARYTDWEVEKTAAGSADTLIIDYHGIGSDYVLKLIYVKRHDSLYSDSDTLDETVRMERVVPGAVVNLLLRSLMDMNTADENIGDFINIWERRAERARQMHNPRLPGIDGKVMSLGTLNRTAQVQDI